MSRSAPSTMRCRVSVTPAGHNMIAAMAVGAAQAAARVADDVGLTVSVIGTPAEEGGEARSCCWIAASSPDVHAAHDGASRADGRRPAAVPRLARNRDPATPAKRRTRRRPERGINAADALTDCADGDGCRTTSIGAGCTIMAACTSAKTPRSSNRILPPPPLGWRPDDTDGETDIVGDARGRLGGADRHRRDHVVPAGVTDTRQAHRTRRRTRHAAVRSRRAPRMPSEDHRRRGSRRSRRRRGRHRAIPRALLLEADLGWGECRVTERDQRARGHVRGASRAPALRPCSPPS